jgi:hypothetical protein
MIEDLLIRMFTREWTVLFLTAALLLVVAEVGFRFGSRRYTQKREAPTGHIGGIQAAVLGMLGLLLAFTFAMAVDRYDTRRKLVLQEANAVHTTYLRASLLPEAHQAPVKDLLRRYVDGRVKYQPLADDPAKLAEGRRLSGDIQTELWKHASEAAKEAPNDITVSFIDSLNETIDTDADRIAAGRAHIPSGVWLLLLVVAASGSFISGYGAGADGVRTILVNVFLPLLITVVIVLIFDLSHPRQGLIGISQQPLIDLQKSIAQ